MLNNIAVEYDPDLFYPADVPFNPQENYPEYLFGETSAKGNGVYARIRILLKNTGLDQANFGTSAWNPFGEFIKPGSKVVLKPNWVREMNPVNNDISGLVTHPSVLRAVIDYVLIALKEKGEIIIGDAPIQSADFGLLLKKLGIKEILDFYSARTAVRISAEDFRKEIKVYSSDGDIAFRETRDDVLFTEVNLGRNSYLAEIENLYRNFRVTNYNPDMMLKYHGPGKNIYLIARKVLDADVVIQLPKLKTHRKAGITCCMKNTVGINSAKDALVHHLKGSRTFGGDAYPVFNILKSLNEYYYELRERTGSGRIRRLATSLISFNDGIMKKTGMNRFFEGSWYGNSTLWRMMLDINGILFFADNDGKMNEEARRRVFYLVDGITGGEGDGPLKPDNRQTGVLLGTFHPVAGDMTAASLIGFDYRKITAIKKALENNFLGLGFDKASEMEVVFNGKNTPFGDLPSVALYEPPAGWKNNIEKKTNKTD